MFTIMFMTTVKTTIMIIIYFEYTYKQIRSHMYKQA